MGDSLVGGIEMNFQQSAGQLAKWMAQSHGDKWTGISSWPADIRNQISKNVHFVRRFAQYQTTSTGIT